MTRQSQDGAVPPRTITPGAGESSPGGSEAGNKAARELAAGLYLVATPIGNLGDITLRALALLRAAATIACEDTRVTQKLLSAHGIPAAGRLVAYHAHNEARETPRLLARIAAGEAVALASDAGTPLLSDPGERLVAACLEAGLPVTALPGPAAALVALQLSGLPPQPFLFAGFLPAKAAARRTAVEALRAVPATLIFYEAPHRLVESLAALAETLGPRPAAVARELTKRFEEVRRGPLDALAAHYAEAGPPKGEIVLLVGPPAAEAPADAAELDRLLLTARREMSLRDAVAAVAGASGLPKRQVYARALELEAASGERHD